MSAYLPTESSSQEGPRFRGSLEPRLKFGYIVPYHSVSCALLARSTSEGLRIAGITAPVDVDSLYPPAS